MKELDAPKFLQECMDHAPEKAFEPHAMRLVDRQMLRPGCAAFTLTELLVVIAIIGILSALLLPTLSRGKQKARQTQCASNLKQLSMAVHMYVGENRDTLPGPTWLGLYYTYNLETERTLYYLAGYLGMPAPSSTIQTSLVALCPLSAAIMREPANTPADSLSRPVCYIVSSEITNAATGVVTHPFGYPYSSPFYRATPQPDEPPKTVADILNPSTSWAVTDADQQNALSGGLYYPMLPETPVHGVVRNQLFFDWHVAAVK